MARWVFRIAVLRLLGRRAMPALMALDLLFLANRVRRIPTVDRSLRRAASTAGGPLHRAARRATHPSPRRADMADDRRSDRTT